MKKNQWSTETLEKFKNEFPNRYNKELANELGIGLRTVTLKARQLNIEKDTDFLIVKKKIEWTTEMLDKFKREFPHKFNRELAQEFGVSYRTVVKKARQLKLEKQTNFLQLNKPIIQKMARVATTVEVIQRVHSKRNASIKRDKLRLAYGLDPYLKMKLNPKELLT
jgi:hypothetical protein